MESYDGKNSSYMHQMLNQPATTKADSGANPRMKGTSLGPLSGGRWSTYGGGFAFTSSREGSGERRDSMYT